MHSCPICHGQLKIDKLSCGECQLEFTGSFRVPRLMRLAAGQQRLAEQFLLAGGNLKDLAQNLGITYPTLRKQIDGLIHDLQGLRREDEQLISSLLDKVEKGELSAEAANRHIRELNGDA
jgi:hypothetical protein